MVNFSQLLTLAAFGSGMAAANLHIEFKRFSDDKCDPKQHIHSTSDLHDTTCKDFSHHEPLFHSFSYKITEGRHHEAQHKDCHVIVHEGKDCTGKAINYGDILSGEDACSAVPWGAKSVKVECVDKKPPEPLTVSPAPKPSTQTVTRKPTVTVTRTHEHPQKHTITLVPKRRVQHCEWVDEDDW